MPEIFTATSHRLQEASGTNQSIEEKYQAEIAEKIDAGLQSEIYSPVFALSLHVVLLARVKLKPMFYVYILQSVAFPDHYYVGITEDLKARLATHNAKEVPHTSKYAPWKLKTYVALSDKKQAFEFEKYLKTASGRAFAKKRL